MAPNDPARTGKNLLFTEAILDREAARADAEETT